MVEQPNLLEEFILKRKYDFTRLFKNEPLERPKGNISLAVLFEPSHRTNYRLYLLKNEKSYCFVGQMANMVYREEQIPFYKKSLEYSKSVEKIIPDILDIDDHFFNLEWHFDISESYYNSIFKDLSNIYIPIKSSESGLDGINREIYINPVFPIHVRW